MTEFTPVGSLLGGVLIGLAALGLMYFNGRVAGISGIFADSVQAADGERGWRWAFIGGLMVGGLVAFVLVPTAFASTVHRSIGALVLAGLLVGTGTQLGGGCTSGHGVCGIGRFSKRSIVATLTFMATAAVTVFVVAEVFGGSL
ncbi:MAG: YeeE/YedE family protein [Sandaracinaceae bacterium]|nr:YeeE/YedE family protein [Sandaracinaceae bacterium]